MMRFITRYRATREEEAGFALITVMLALLALMVLSTAIIEYGIGSQFTSKHDENWNAALAAAQAGVNDYLHRLNTVSNYYTYGNVGAETKDPANGAMAGFVDVPGSTPVGRQQFTYWADSTFNTTSLSKNGTIVLTASGKVGTTSHNAVRTIQVSFRAATFLDFLYYTDIEIVDPTLATGQPAVCASPHHAYTQGAITGYDPLQKNANCQIIYFFGDSTRHDTINGPLHTNDQLHVCGAPTFNGSATTSYPGYQPTALTPVKPGDRLWLGRSGCTNAPQFVANSDTTNIDYSDPIPPLPSNAQLETYTGGSTGGCNYQGPTKITFNPDGTMSVKSPTTTAVSAGCPVDGATGNLPADGVIYVADASPTIPMCNKKVGNLVGYPVKNDVTTYSCTKGDLFVSGTLKGQVTLGAKEDIVVVGDLLYHDKAKGNMSYQGTDLLGAIANRYVAVYHPVNSSGNELIGYLSDPEIDGAVVSVTDSFYVQKWGSGDPTKTGTLSAFGAIAQEYRGAVGTFGCGPKGDQACTGYIKNYNYDNRLKYLEPPYFLNPTATAFAQSTWKELPPTTTGP